MKWLVVLFITSLIGLAGTYNHIIDLQESLGEKDLIILILKVELEELKEKEDAWYKEQIEKWVVPYEIKISGDILHIKVNPGLKQKGAQG